MASADELRAQLAVAELEEQLAAAKGGDADTGELKHELRYRRWLSRGGHLADPDEDNPADKAHRDRHEEG